MMMVMMMLVRASGASKWAYWTANFIWDAGILFLHLLLFAAALTCADYTDYGGSNAGPLIGALVMYLLAELMRFYVVSFWIGDVRMAQSIYFYGSLLIMYTMAVIWINTVFVGANGNIEAPSVRAVTYICSIVDPTFAMALFVVYQRNFLGAQTMHQGAEDDLVPAMAIAFAIALVLFIAIEAGDDIAGYVRNKMEERREKKRYPGSTSGGSAVFITADRSLSRVVHSEPQKRIAGQRDPDVQHEQELVDAIFSDRKINCEQHSILIHKLQKVYPGRGTVPTKVAVKDVCLVVPQGEVFGLLGANGAGKVSASLCHRYMLLSYSLSSCMGIICM